MAPSPLRGRGWAPALALLVGLGVAACSGSREPDPDEQFGVRVEEEGPEERETMLITPPDSTEEFFYYPAYVAEVTVRPGPAGPQGRRPVELLLKGALPDACTALHRIERTGRVGNIIDVAFEMRRPKGAVCAQVVRPYRFYYELDEPLEPGDYTLRINDAVHPFSVRPMPVGEGE